MDTLTAKRNDDFRKSVMRGLKSKDGKAIRTQGVAALGSLTNVYLQAAIAAFSTFTADNDPHGEHDFGTIELEGVPKVFWKIDFYEDSNLEFGTEDRLNAYRVLVIMLAEEY